MTTQKATVDGILSALAEIAVKTQHEFSASFDKIKGKTYISVTVLRNTDQMPTMMPVSYVVQPLSQVEGFYSVSAETDTPYIAYVSFNYAED